MKNVYTLNEQKDGLLFRQARQGLMEMIGASDENYDKYLSIIEDEITELKKINFDGWMLLLADVVLVSREISGFVSAFGSIQNSFTAYALGIVDYFDFKNYDFKRFTPFREKPVVNIVISSYANAGCMGYVKHKFPHLIKKTKKRTIIFKENLKIKFVDLDIDIKVKQDQDW
jgi:hypothetical protein